MRVPADTQYMQRCIQLGTKGRGYVSPNPLVGAVVVCNNRIIGEGYHRKMGEPHAEVNAIASVKDKNLLKDSTIYVSLEPCSHYGKTPPCAQLIIDSKIPKVVIGCLDPFPKVSGQGIEMLKQAGVDVTVGILGEKCRALNKEFNTVQLKNRPYIYLKWAQSADGFMDKLRTDENQKPTIISNNFTKLLVHKLRAQTDAILVATNTAIADNPSLTTRLWYGKNPVRVIIDRKNRIPKTHSIFDHSVETIILTEKKELEGKAKNTEYLYIEFNTDFFCNLFLSLKNKGISSIMIEGGGAFLQSLVSAQLWDEAYLEVSNSTFGKGTKAPIIDGEIINIENWMQSKRLHLQNKQD